MSLDVIGSIGSVNVHGWSGWLYDLEDVGEDFARLGQTGSGAQVTMKRARKSSIAIWSLHTSVGAGAAQVAALLALQWTVVPVITGDDRNFPRVRVESVNCEAPRAGGGTAVSGTQKSGCLVRATLTMEVQP